MKKYDLCVKTGSYNKNGESKSSYENIGVMLDNGNGPFILLKSHFNPAGIVREEGRCSILVSLFAPKESTEKAQPREEQTFNFDEQHTNTSGTIPF